VAARKVFTGRGAGGLGTPGLQLFATYHNFGPMPSRSRDRPKPTTPEEEGIELHPDAWQRFERTVDRVVKSPPAHRTAKPTGADQPKRKRRAPADDK
jgi:hypothetical protein